jgi:hypothetical protein
MKTFWMIFLNATILFIVSSYLFAQDSKAGSDVETKPSEMEIHRITIKDNSITAIWIGDDPNTDPDLSGMPLEYGVHKVFFEFLNGNEKILFKPTGELFFSDWSFNIFSQNYKYVILLQGHFGPYHIIPIENLRDYLSGKITQFETVSGQQTLDDPGAVHGEIKWLSFDTIKFRAFCCGGSIVVIHQIGKKTKYGKWEERKKPLK